jgi:hypothetical protein
MEPRSCEASSFGGFSETTYERIFEACCFSLDHQLREWSLGENLAARIIDIPSQRAASFMKWMEGKARDALVAGHLDQQFPEAIESDRMTGPRSVLENEHLRFVNDRDRERQPPPDTARQVLG